MLERRQVTQCCTDHKHEVKARGPARASEYRVHFNVRMGLAKTLKCTTVVQRSSMHALLDSTACACNV